MRYASASSARAAPPAARGIRTVMNRRSLPLVAACMALACAASAADREAGRLQAMKACAVCHGPTGISMVPNTPHLAGQPAPYVREQLRQYRSGERRHEIMEVISRPLTDAQIDNLSEWFASIRIEAREP